MNTIARRLTSGAALALAAAALPLAMPATAAHAATGDFVTAEGRVTASTLAVRANPTTAAARVATLKKNVFVTPVCSVTGQRVEGSSTWYWVTAEPVGGWVSAHYTRVTMGSVPTCSSFHGMRLMNADITSASQVNSRLAGTSASFRAFIAKDYRSVTTGCPATIDVQAWWSDNQAVGNVEGCGGYVAVWTLKNGTWHETGWNGDVSCATLRAAGATHAIPGNLGVTCTVRNGRTLITKQFVPTR